MSALKSPIYQGFQGLADKADKADNRVVKFVFLSAEKGVRRTTTRLADNKFSREFLVRLLSARGICCPPERFSWGCTCTFHLNGIRFRYEGVMSVNEKKPPLEKTVVNQIRAALKAAGVKWIMKTHGSPYQQSGVPDLLCIAPGSGRLVGIEVKRPNGTWKVTELQKQQIALIREAGGVAGVATSVEEALALLEEGEKIHESH